MKRNTIIQNALLVLGDELLHGDLRIEDDRIAEIATHIPVSDDSECIDARGRTLMPGLIDDQVHFREPGHEHKGNLETESHAAVLGGITSVLEMPNTMPPTTTVDAFNDKLERAHGRMGTNYSFYLGATDENLDTLKRAKEIGACGIKIFMGASTGTLLVENEDALLRIFQSAPTLIATHCEDSKLIRERRKLWGEKYGEPPTPAAHAFIRNEESCYRSSSLAVALARETNARLHVLHLTTEKEMQLFSRGVLDDKRITAEACVHHLFFDESDYERLGHRIKWNPSIKSAEDREALLRAVNEDRIDVIATDHAPHTWEEKNRGYDEAPSGGPLVEHALLALLDLCSRGVFSLQTVVRKMAHAPAQLFGIRDRGCLKVGYYADLVLVDLKQTTTVLDEHVASRAGWSPFHSRTFGARVTDVWVNGTRAVRDGRPSGEIAGRRLEIESA